MSNSEPIARHTRSQGTEEPFEVVETQPTLGSSQADPEPARDLPPVSREEYNALREDNRLLRETMSRLEQSIRREPPPLG